MGKFFRAIVVFMALFSATLTFAGTGAYAGALDDGLEAGVGELRAGMEYGVAREHLVSSGWQPVRYPWQDRGCGLGREDVCDAFPEAEACAGTGLANCRFTFLDHNRRQLILTTIGEGADELSLEQWWFQAAE